MKTSLTLMFAGIACLLLSACSMAEASRAVDAGFAILTAIAPLIPPEKMQAMTAAVSQGGDVAATAFGAIADVLHSFNTEATAKFAAQATILQQQAVEISNRITTGEAATMVTGGTLLGGGLGTGISRALSASKHGFMGKKLHEAAAASE